MAGLSSRFTKAGYTLPKYMLYVKDKSLFNLSVVSFNKYFDSCRFIFVIRDVFDTKKFVENECNLLGIKDFEIVKLDQQTRGQAETVLKGLVSVNLPASESILIFNIDTFRFGFTFPDKIEEWDGYLEVFEGSGVNWSYAKTENDNSTKVIETAEKKEISHYCSTGIYYFKSVSDFINVYNVNASIDKLKELYVAPLYNLLIRDGKNIHIDLIQRNEVVFCGVPQEYADYLKSTITSL